VNASTVEVAVILVVEVMVGEDILVLTPTLELAAEVFVKLPTVGEVGDAA
jgi:hypothetical protein